MRKSPARLYQSLSGVSSFDWTSEPLETFRILRSAVNLYYCYKQERSNGQEPPTSPQDYIVCWSDSARFINRAFALYKKTKHGPVCVSSSPILQNELQIWNQLDLGIIPQEVAHMVEPYYAGYLTQWIAFLVEELQIKDFPENSFAREECLRFTQEGALIFTWGSIIRRWNPVVVASGSTGWQKAGCLHPSYSVRLEFNRIPAYPKPKIDNSPS